MIIKIVTAENYLKLALKFKGNEGKFCLHCENFEAIHQIQILNLTF